LALLAVVTHAHGWAQTVGFSRAAQWASQGAGSPYAQLKVTGGWLMDWKAGHWAYTDPVTKATTDYASFAAMWSALSGSMTSSAKWIFNSAGTLSQIAANTPAQPCYSGAGALRGWCWENAAANAVWPSEGNFASAQWTKTGVSVTDNNRTSPKGTSTASTLKEDTSTGEHSWKQTVSKTGVVEVWTASCYFGPSAGNRALWVRVQNSLGNGVQAIFATDFVNLVPPGTTGIGGTPLTARTWLDPAGTDSNGNPTNGGWVRGSLTVTTATDTSLTFTYGLASQDSTPPVTSYTGNGNSALAVFGCEAKHQEVGVANTQTSPTSYVQTTTGAVTRVTDQSIKFNNPANMQSRPDYSALWFGYLNRASNQTSNVFWSMENAANTHRITMGQNNDNVQNSFYTQVVDSTTLTITMAGPLLTFDQLWGIAAVYKPKSYWVENSGQSVKTSTGVIFPSDPLVQVQVGSTSSGSTLTGNNSILTLAVYAEALPTKIMQGLLFANPPFNPDVVVPPNFFQPFHNADIPSGWHIWRSYRVPNSADESGATYLAYPVNYVYGQSIAANLGEPAQTYPIYWAWLPWGHRCDLCGPPTPSGLKPNSAGGPQFNTSNGHAARVSYSTFDKADAALLSQVLYVLGAPATAAPGSCGTGPQSATATGTASGTSITISGTRGPSGATGTVGFLWKNYPIQGIGVPANTVLTAQTSGTSGGDGVYTTNNPTTANGDVISVYSSIDYCGYQDPATAYGVGMGPDYATIKANPDPYFPNTVVIAGIAYSTITDHVYWPDGQFGSDPNAKWIVGDMEQADNRNASRQTALQVQLTNIAHKFGKKYAAAVDGLVGAGVAGGFCGIGATGANCDTGPDGNVGFILNWADEFFIPGGRPPPKGYTYEGQFEQYLQMIGPAGTFDPSHIIWQFQFGVWPGGTFLSDSGWMRNWINSTGAGGAQIVPVFAQLGGGPTRCTNQKTNLLIRNQTVAPVYPGCHP
jgi:hypothetical protein